MKNKKLVHHYESTKIYQHHYRPSFNVLKVVKSILAVLITGSAATASHYKRMK